MITDPRPRGTAKRAEYDRSDQMTALSVPEDSRLHELALGIESALASESKTHVRTSCERFLEEAGRLYAVSCPKIRVLESRPLRVRETGVSELFGDYQLETALIRIWMRTAVRERMTSFGTFISTLCHEICHHLDLMQLGFPNSFHTRGFYGRTAVLYHHCRGTPLRPLLWRRIPNDRWRVDWVWMRGPRMQVRS